MERYVDYQLSERNTFGIKSLAREFIEYDNTSELIDILRELNTKQFDSCASCTPNEISQGSRGFDVQKFLFIGGGSNMLFTEDFQGTVIHGRINGIEIKEKSEEFCLVRVGAAVVWDDFVKWTLENNLYGIENLSLIPGETGASAVQNIGAYGMEVSEVIERVEVINADDLAEYSFHGKDCHYAYRNSFFKEAYNRYAIHHVIFRLNRKFRPVLRYKALQQEFSRTEDSVTARDVRNFIVEMRRNKLPDPKVLGNAGSFYMNPIVSADKFSELCKRYSTIPHYKVGDDFKIPAAWLIEQCGWKGRRINHVGVYEKQPLVLVNYGGASAQEIIALSNRIVNDVKEKFQIELRPEVQFV